MTTAFEHDMGQMVKESKASEAKKSLAMNYVRATGKISNGSRGDIHALCDALIAQTPIILEMYLEPRVLVDEVSRSIAKHIEDCPGLKVIKLRGEGGDGLAGINWQRFMFSVATKVRWPGVCLVALVMFKAEFSQLIMSVVK